MAESEEELKSLLMKVKEESEKTGLILNIQEIRSWHLVPSDALITYGERCRIHDNKINLTVGPGTRLDH